MKNLKKSILAFCLACSILAIGASPVSAQWYRTCNQAMADRFWYAAVLTAWNPLGLIYYSQYQVHRCH